MDYSQLDPETIKALLAQNSSSGLTAKLGDIAGLQLPSEAVTDPSKDADYNEIFNALPDAKKSATDSAKVFESTPSAGAAEQAEANMAQAAKSAIGDSIPAAEDAAASAAPEMAGSALGAVSKAAGPLGLLAGLYGGQAGAAGLDDVQGKTQFKQDKPPTPPGASASWTPPLGDVMGPPSSLATPPPSDDDTEDSSPTAKVNAKAAAPSIGNLLQQMQARQPAPPEATGYDKSIDADALAQAQAKQRQDTMWTNIAKGFDTIGAGFSRGAFKADPSFYDDLQKGQIAAPVNHILQQRQAADAATAHQMEQYKLADEKEKNDPNSAASALARNVLTSSAAAAKLNLGNIDGLSASTIEKTFPSVAKLIDTQSQNLTRQETAKDRAAALKIAAGNKENDKEKQNYNQTVQQLEQLRGSPAAGQAEKDIYAAQKANDVLKTFAPSGNLNDVSLQGAALLKSEIAKIANGGQASIPSLQELDADTVNKHLAMAKQKLFSEPTPANAGAFLQQYKDYADNLTKTAQNTISDRYGRIINSRSSDLNDDHQQLLKDNYLNRFKEATKAVGTPRSPQSASQYSPAQESGIQAVMNGNKVDRDTAIAALKKAGKI